MVIPLHTGPRFLQEEAPVCCCLLDSGSMLPLLAELCLHRHPALNVIKHFLQGGIILGSSASTMGMAHHRLAAVYRWSSWLNTADSGSQPSNNGTGTCRRQAPLGINLPAAAASHHAMSSQYHIVIILHYLPQLLPRCSQAVYIIYWLWTVRFAQGHRSQEGMVGGPRGPPVSRN